MMRRPSSNSSRTAAIAILTICMMAPPAHILASNSNSAFNKTYEAPAAEHLVQARATSCSRGVLVEWSNGIDTATLGFNVYRISSCQRTKLNSSLIAGSALIVRSRELSYAWMDPAGFADSQYEVESIDLRGDSSDRVVVQSNWTEMLPEYRQSELLSNLGGSKVVATTNPDWLETDQRDRSLPAASGDLITTTLAQQWMLANQPALKIGVRADGWYRITQPQMAAAGFDTIGDARNLQLFVAGSEVAISVSRENGQLSSTDFVEFWGQGVDIPTTDTQVYWLINGAQAGKRIAIKGELQPTVSAGPVTLSNQPAPTTPSPFSFAGVGTSLIEPVIITADKGREVAPAQVINNATVST